MRLFVTGDVHGDIDYRKLKDFRKLMKHDLTLDDCLIICGDFGILWDSERHDRYFKERVYGDFPCTILWICGNHENFDTLYSYPVETWNGGKIHRITDRIFHLMRGEVFTLPTIDTETKIFAFGGAMSTDRGYDTGNNRYWWPQELPSQDEIDNASKNLASHSNNVDYIFTHDGPRTALQVIMGGALRLTEKIFSSFLESLAHTVDFKGWYFGHHHNDKSHDKYQCMYNGIRELT